MQADQGLLLHPMVATVTYLSAPRAAAATVVLERPSPLLADESPCGDVPHATACWPAIGRHLCFDGKLLHGALPDLAPPRPAAGATPGKRVTLLVNVWLNHVPWGAERLPASIGRKLRPIKSAKLGLGRVGEVGVTSIGVKSGEVQRWSFGDAEAKLQLALPWPRAAVAAAVAQPAAPLVGVSFSPGTGAALLSAPPKSQAKRLKKQPTKEPEKELRKQAKQKRGRDEGSIAEGGQAGGAASSQGTRARSRR